MAIAVTDLIRVRRQVRKATEAACLSTYRPAGGRLYEPICLWSLAKQTDYASMQAARHDREQEELERFNVCREEAHA